MIFITGQHAAGKTRFAELYQQKFGYDFIDLGPSLRREWVETKPDLTFSQFITQGENAYGKHFTDSILAAKIEEKLRAIKQDGGTRDLLVIGSRSIEGINYLRDKIPVINGKPRTIIYIEADEEILFARYRRREGRDITLDEFRRILEEDRKRGVVDIKPHADKIIVNEGPDQQFELECSSVKCFLDGSAEGRRGGVERQ